MNSSNSSDGFAGTHADGSRHASNAPPRATRAGNNSGKELRQSSILLVHPRDSEGDALAREIKRMGCQLEMTWPPPSIPPLGFDFALVALNYDVLTAASWLSGAPPLPVVAVIDGQKGIPADVLRLSNAQAVLAKPCLPAVILTNLILARQMFSYERRLLNKVAKLEETLHASRQIEQAKHILMQQRNIRANEAYDHLRQQAMSKQKSVAAISAALVDAYELIE